MSIARLLAVPAILAAIVSGTSAATAQSASVEQGHSAVAGTATASLPSVTVLQSLATGYALDSNYNGYVYAIPSNGGRYQKWAVNRGANGGVTVRNVQTGRCLDSNTAGRVYTLRCNGGSFQSWIAESAAYGTVNLRNVATGFVLDGNAAHRVYTMSANGGSYQKWVSRRA